MHEEFRARVYCQYDTELNLHVIYGQRKEEGSGRKWKTVSWEKLTIDQVDCLAVVAQVLERIT